MKRLIVVGAALLAGAAGAMDLAEAARIFDVPQAYVVRAQRAVAWSQGKAEPVTVDEVAAEMLSRLNAIIVQQEVSHGIDPATGEADPTKLAAQVESERSQKEAAQEALADAVAEADSLRKALEVERAAVVGIGAVEVAQ